MRKIIDGKMYDTKTAKLIGKYNDYLGRKDFNHIEEYLYKKRTGEFFLYGEGGALTQYRERYGNMWGDGVKIIPLTIDKAKKWAEEKLTTDEYMEIFNVNE